MTFTVLAVRTGEEPETPLYPDPGDMADSIEREATDGTLATSFEATALMVSTVTGPRTQQLSRVSDIKARVIVSDSRVAVACSKFDKGGGWSGFSVGGLAVAVTANAVSKARAKRRRKGKMLVGHVRYEWLTQIDAKDRTGLLSRNSLQLFMSDPTGTQETVLLDITLSKHESATGAADGIVRRAATHLAKQAAAEGSGGSALAARATPAFESMDGGGRRYRLLTP